MPDPLRSWPALIVVAPHPDDETLGAGGLIHQYGTNRRRIIVVSVTDGEAACPEIPELARVRRAELRSALGMLAADHAEIIRLGLPDGRVDEHRALLHRALTAITVPDALWVAPFERDGHPDHDAAGQVARQVARERGTPLVAYPIWAWHHGGTEIFSGRRLIRMELDPAARVAKRAACRCHHSQLRERLGGAIVPPQVLAYFDRPYETYVS